MSRWLQVCRVWMFRELGNVEAFVEIAVIKRFKLNRVGGGAVIGCRLRCFQGCVQKDLTWVSKIMLS